MKSNIIIYYIIENLDIKIVNYFVLNSIEYVYELDIEFIYFDNIIYILYCFIVIEDEEYECVSVIFSYI